MTFQLNRLILFLLFVFILCGRASTQDCIGNYELTSQAELADFAELGCVNVIGNLKVADYHVTDISALSTIRTISGFFWITGISVESLEALSNLERVDSFFLIYYMPELKSLEGLQHLQQVGDRFAIGADYYLESVAALTGLQSARRLEITGNPKLISLGTFPALTTLTENLIIHQNNLPNGIAAFHHLKKAKNIEIYGNDLNGNITGFEQVDSLQFLKLFDNDSLFNISGFKSLKLVEDGIVIDNNPLLTGLHGFDSLDNVGVFSIISTGLHELPELPRLKKLEDLFVSANEKMDSMHIYPGLESLGRLYVTRNPVLKTISATNLPDVIDEISVSQNANLESIQIINTLDSIHKIDLSSNPNLVEVNDFPQLKYASQIQFRNNLSLSTLPQFPNLQHVNDYLRTEGMHINMLDQFPKLETIGSLHASTSGIFFDSLTVTAPGAGFPGLKNVHHLSLTYNSFSNLEFFPVLNEVNGDLVIEHNADLQQLFTPKSLRQIQGKISLQHNGQLKDISSLDSIAPQPINEIVIVDNPSLQACNVNWVCKATDADVPVTFEKNANGCISEYDVRKNCGLVYSHIVSMAYYDKNQNGIQDAGEPLLPSVEFKILPTNEVLLSHATPLSYYTPFGDYRVAASIHNFYSWEQTSPIDTFDITLTENTPFDTVRFGFYPTIAIDSTSSRIFSSRLLCLRHITLRAFVINDGTTLSSGTLWIKLDSNVTNLYFVVPPDHLNGDLAGYDFENLFPGQKLFFIVQFSVPGPEVIVPGNNLYFSSFVTNENGVTSKPFEYEHTVFCAFDPNDKQVSPNRENHATLSSEELLYTIRFQNTGNYPATDIRVLDTLDANLDMTTVRVLDSSHPQLLVTSIEDQTIRFDFSGIYLPDSISNEPASHGYIDFGIKPNNSVQPGTVINNKASIYFDANPPVLTNTTENKFVSRLSNANVRAWYADGQVWIIWNISQPIPETMGIYALPSPFPYTTEGTLIGRPFVFDYLPTAFKEQVDTSATYRIPDGHGGTYTLVPNEGLFVFTPHQAGESYFAVVPYGDSIINPGDITAASVPYNYDPINDPVECHLQASFPSPFTFPGTYQCFAFYMWCDGREDQNAGRPDFPVTANAAKNGSQGFFFISVPTALDTTHPFSLSVWLHGGGGTARQSLAGSRKEVNINPVDGILVAHNDDVFGYRGNTPPNPENPSLHFGYRKHWDPFTTNNFPTQRDTVINYTQRRYLWIDQWLINNFNIDTGRIYIHGHSMGSWGATALAKAYPSHYASAFIFNNGFRAFEPGSNIEAMFGPLEENFPTHFINRGGGNVFVKDLFDLVTNISPERDFPVFHSYHAKNDTGDSNYWGIDVVNNYKAADQRGLGMKLFWSERAHGIDTGPDYDDHWVNGNDADENTITDNVTFAEQHYRSDESYPAFSFHELDPNAHDPGDGTPGTGPNGSGDDWGTWGGYHRWDRTSLIDEPHQWSVIAWLENSSIYPNDNCPNQSLLTSFTIRKALHFKPAQGSQVTYKVTTLGGTILQTGQSQVLQDDLILIPDLIIYREDVRKIVITISDLDVAISPVTQDDRSVFLYPNPISQNPFLHLNATTAGKGNLQLYTLEGKKVEDVQFQYEAGVNEIRLQFHHHLAAGMYLACIRTEEETAMQRILNSEY